MTNSPIWVLFCSAVLTVVAASAQVGPPVDAHIKLAGEQFDRLCEGCHGDRGEGGDRAPALINNRDLRCLNENQIRDLIKNGTPGGMPPFALADQELGAQLLRDAVNLIMEGSPLDPLLPER